MIEYSKMVWMSVVAMSVMSLTACDGDPKADSNGDVGMNDGGKNNGAEDAGADLGIAGEFEVAKSDLQRVTEPGVDDATVKQLAEDNADFAMALWGEVAEPGENLFYSPYSISVALAMTYAGAEGNTETQMSDALRLRLDEQQLHPAFNALSLALESRGSELPDDEEGDPFQLEVANSIWGQTGFPFVQDFLDLLAKNYGAGMRLLDFAAETEKSRQVINAWVERKTKGRIKDLIPQGVITDLTRLVLTNAVYFKASWKTKFDEAATTKGPFTKKDASTVQADLMHLKGEEGFRYFSGQDFSAAELPYVGDDVSMVVILPDSGKFDAVEQSLDGAAVMQVFDGLQPQALELTFPRFEFTSTLNLNEALSALGMPQAFTDSADFSGITTATQLFIQGVLHKAFVKVDEEGTEAAAATAVVVGTTSVPQFETFAVNRPFIFFIRDRATNAVIFAGRVLDPG